MAPPCHGPHRAVIPAAIQAKGLAKEEPAILTVEVDAFYSWSACNINITSKACTITGSTLNSSIGVENIYKIRNKIYHIKEILYKCIFLWRIYYR